MGLFGVSNSDLLLELKAIRKQADRMERSLTTIGPYLGRIDRRTKQILTRLLSPGQLALTVTGENGVSLKFQIQLPAPPTTPNDIVKGLLDVSVAGVALPSIDTSPGQSTVDAIGFEGADNDAVDVRYVYVDDAGNESGVSTLSITLTDTLAPPTPGALGLTVTEET